MQCLTGVFPKSKTEEVPAGPLELVKCDQCALVQLAHNYDLSTLYGDNYGYRSGLNASMVSHLHGKVKRILERVAIKPGDLIVDIGSNDSTLLQAYPGDGVTLVGVDPTGQKFKRLYPPHIRLVPSFFSADAVRDSVGPQRAKIVTSIAMFYDLERPVAFMEEVGGMLEDDGVWVFEQSYLPFMLDTNSYDTVCHEHLEYYGVKQIREMAGRVGFKIVDLEFNDVNGGSFSVMAAKRDAPYPEAAAAVDRALEDEERRGLATRRPYELFRERATIHRQQLNDFLRRARSEGRSTLGYGASTKGNVVLQYCGVTEADLPFIAEVNEDKFGAHTPGTKIPIVSEREARRMKPDYFLVLPWHFKKGIVEKEAGFLRSGGKLVFPLPALEVVSG